MTDTGPYDLPPGPERRKALGHEGRNVTLADFTEAELAELDFDERDLDWKSIWTLYEARPDRRLR